MKTNDLLNELNQNISDAYDVIEAGGGAMPTDRITWNLANAIRTIPEPVPPIPPVPPTDILYGKVGTYPWSEDAFWSGDNVEVNSVNQETLNAFLAEYPNDYPEFMYEMDWESETPEENYVWWYYWEGGELKIQPEDFTATTGIDCTVEEGADWASLYYERDIVVDTEGEITYREYASLEEFNTTQGEYLTIDGDSVYKNAVYSIETGSEITALPDYFASDMQNLAHIDLTHSPIDTIGAYCIEGLAKFNEPLVIPPRITAIPNYFMYSLSSFNQTVTVPYGVTTIGDYFLGYNRSLNSTVTLPRGVQTIGNSFMASCQTFNQPIEIPYTVTSIGAGLLYGCSVFNQPVTLPQGLTSLGGSFLAYCYEFNQPVTIPDGVTKINDRFLSQDKKFNSSVSLPKNADSIGSWFMDYCSEFNQPIRLPKKVKAIGNYFMQYCIAFNSNITMPEELTSISGYFLAYNKVFNKPVTLPNTLTSIGIAFIGYCDNFNQHITVPASVTRIDSQFMARCYSFSAGVTCNCPATVFGSYTDAFIVNGTTMVTYDSTRLGIPFDGTYAVQWQTKFPWYLTSYQQRKTYVEQEVPAGKLCLTNGTMLNITVDDLPSLCYQQEGSPSVVIDGTTVTKNMIYGVNISNFQIETIPAYFLDYCKSLKKLILPPYFVNLGLGFLRYCDAFDYPITFSQYMETLGGDFMVGCISFNQDLTLPASLKYASPNFFVSFMYECRRMTSTLYCYAHPGYGTTTPDRVLACSSNVYPMFTEGVKLAGPYAQEWKNKYEDLQSSVYRKLILVS